MQIENSNNNKIELIKIFKMLKKIALLGYIGYVILFYNMKKCNMTLCYKLLEG